MKKLFYSNQDDEGRVKWFEITNSILVKRKMGPMVLKRLLQRTMALKEKVATISVKKICGQMEKRCMQRKGTG